MSASTRLVSMLARLELASGRPKPPPPDDPLEIILWENVAYLVNDERRAAAFRALRKQVGLEPRRILSAHPDRLLEVARLGGMHPELRVKKILTIAQIAVEKFGGELRRLRARPNKIIVDVHAATPSSRKMPCMVSRRIS